LRAQGLTIPQIAEKTGASKGSVSPWVARRRAAERREELRRRACEEFGEPSVRDLFVAGVALYWAEGAKAKPWRRGGSVDFVNSDVDVLRTFLSWLDLLGIPKQDRKFRLSIHESADVAASERWWSEKLAFFLGGVGSDRAEAAHATNDQAQCGRQLSRVSSGAGRSVGHVVLRD
jgi:transcriptional regulator with XRE-family HTH domain